MSHDGKVFVMSDSVPAIHVLCATDYSMSRNSISEVFLSIMNEVQIFTQVVQNTFLTVFIDKHNIVGAHDVFRLLCTNADDEPPIFPNPTYSQDFPRLFDAVYRICRQLALSTARRILNFKRTVVVSVSGGNSSRFCQNVSISICNSLLFRQQYCVHESC